MATPLTSPAGGMPPLITSVSEFEKAIAEILSGTGPIAIDAERASGYRYSQRAYLIQIKRTEGGSHLIDPIAVGPTSLWSKLGSELEDQEWIIHASTQDLPCLREVGLQPKILFDTELGGRIAGCERVGLGPLCEALLDISLAKEHSAVDWSMRPLRDEWLNYAALDVEVLIELRNAVSDLLEAQGKLEWAMEDFAAIIKAPPAPPKKDPWRRTSGMHKIRDRQTLAIIKELWSARDRFAAEIDLSPGRVFNDEVLIEIATKRPQLSEMERVITRRGRSANPPIKSWHQLIEDVLDAPASEYPELRVASTGLPPIKMWRDKSPFAYARLTHARAAIGELSIELAIPAENLISPESVRRVCWPEPNIELNSEQQLDQVEDTLMDLGARHWQIDAVALALSKAILEREPIPVAIVETPIEEGPVE